MEKLLHYLWQHRLFPLHPLKTDEGATLEIIDTGLANSDAGPDFFNAKIKINDVLWVGNVEIHMRSSDWFVHGHDEDTAYDSVVLHVVQEADVPVHRSNGEAIPQFILPCPPNVRQRYTELLSASHDLPCRATLEQMPEIKLRAWLSALQIERLEEKTHRIQNCLEWCKGDWERTFFIILSRNFGFGVNSDAFELWARYIPLSAIAKHRDSLTAIEALFFGMGGLLPHENKDDYCRQLKEEYAFLCHKFSITTPPRPNWKYLRLRPSNFPHIRLAQLACLYHHAELLFSQLMEIDNIARLRHLLKGGTSAYWATHDDFGQSVSPHPKTLSDSSIDLLIINTVIPFLYAYGQYLGDEIRCKRAMEWLEKLRPENNHIIRSWGEYGVPIQHAGDTQALIQLQKAYCQPKKCLHCRVGYEYFRTFATRPQ